MIVYPAIDLRQGKCVRLYKGQFDQETVYHTEPHNVAAKFIAEGATWLHIVDLDGAKDVTQNQSALIEDLAKQFAIPIQTGGGIRNKEQVKRLFNKGVARVIIGSLAVHAPKEVAEWITYFGSDKLVLAFDIQFAADKIPYVATHGWQQISEQSLFDILNYYQKFALKHVLCTDIDRDGALTGPNIDLYKALQADYKDLQLQASGGVSSLKDLQTLSQHDLAGAIIGRSLYENKFTLAEALSAVKVATSC
jgi:phosphoribosylformimino-5-aminoimidazole carboxamide ribotide isomerase